MSETVETIDKILKVPEQNSLTNLDFGMLSDYVSDVFLLDFNMKETKEWLNESFRVEFAKLKEMLQKYKETNHSASSDILDIMSSVQKLQLLKNLSLGKNMVFGVTEFNNLLEKCN